MLFHKTAKKVTSFCMAAVMAFSLYGGAAAQSVEVKGYQAPEYLAQPEVTEQSRRMPSALDNQIIVDFNPDQQEQPQQAKEAIAKAILSLQDELDISAYELKEQDLITILEMALPSQYPLAMEMDSYAYGISRLDGYVKYIKFQYPYEKSVMEKRNEQTEQAISAVLARINPEMTELQKIKAVHDYLVSTVAYDLENLQNETIGRTSYTAYGALVEHKAVCQGYALAFQVLMERLGIDSLFVSSEAMNHAWNLVRFGGDWYHVDCTWDDPVPDQAGAVEYDAFMVSDFAISSVKNRHYGWSLELPRAQNTQYDGFDWSTISANAADASGLTLDTDSYQGTVGGSYQFVAKGNLAGQELTVSTSNPAVAAVTLVNADDPRGRLYSVQFLAAGSATILVTSPGGGLASIDITVAAQQAAA